MSWHPYMSGKGLENIDRLDASFSYSNIDVSNLPDYIYEMRSMNAFYMYRNLPTQERCDTFISTLYDKVMGFDYLTMSSVASDGKRNQFYGLYLSIYLASNPDDKRPSGVFQAPLGFVKGVSNGNPQTPMEKIYVLTNNYNQRWVVKPEDTVSLMSFRRYLQDPYMVVVSGKDIIIGHGDVLCDDNALRYVAYGEDDLMNVMSDNGFDINIAIDYLDKERKELENRG